jgi:hypothetical protein
VGTCQRTPRNLVLNRFGEDLLELREDVDPILGWEPPKPARTGRRTSPRDPTRLAIVILTKAARNSTRLARWGRDGCLIVLCALGVWVVAGCSPVDVYGMQCCHGGSVEGGSTLGGRGCRGQLCGVEQHE